eukprot:7106628-Prymnesium_polylepis.1
MPPSPPSASGERRAAYRDEGRIIWGARRRESRAPWGVAAAAGAGGASIIASGHHGGPPRRLRGSRFRETVWTLSGRGDTVDSSRGGRNGTQKPRGKS